MVKGGVGEQYLRYWPKVSDTQSSIKQLPKQYKFEKERITSIKFLITITTSAAIAEWFDVLNGYGNEWGPIWPEIIKGINMDGTNFRRRYGFHKYDDNLTTTGKILACAVFRYWHFLNKSLVGRVVTEMKKYLSIFHVQ